MTKQLLTLLACSLSIAYCAYDGIFVGMGTANSIVASKLVPNNPSKQFLILELGGPLEKRNGGTDYPSYYQSEPNPLTRFDIPGEYSNIPWTPNGQPYQITQAPGWQGKGFGGNSQFNGMLFQSAPDYVLNQWPSGWKASDLAPYYQQLLSTLTITNTPSTDGAKYLTSIAQAFAAGYQSAGWSEQDTRLLGPLQNLDGFYSTPYVVTDGNGQRGGIANAYLSQILTASGTSSKANLEVIGNANVQAILFDSANPTVAIGVQYTLNGQTVTATLNAGGKIIVGAGALMTPRLMYLSGIGPAGSEGSVFAANPVSFVRSNPGIGTLFDHVGSQFSVSASGLTRYNYTDYSANADDIENYIIARKGPYTQYGPVSVAHMKSSPSVPYPDVELFVSPGSVGGSNSAYNSPSSFQAVLMLLSPSSKDTVKLDASYNIRFPNTYYSDASDATIMANAMSRTLNSIVPSSTGLSLNFGPGTSSHPALSPSSIDDLRTYVTGGDQIDGVPYSRMIMNHWCGTVPLRDGSETAGGVEPSTLRVRGTSNVHVVDASLFPTIPASHPVATVMAVGLKAGDLLNAIYASSSTSNLEQTSSTSSTAVISSNPTSATATSATTATTGTSATTATTATTGTSATTATSTSTATTATPTGTTTTTGTSTVPTSSPSTSTVPTVPTSTPTAPTSSPTVPTSSPTVAPTSPTGDSTLTTSVAPTGTSAVPTGTTATPTGTAGSGTSFATGGTTDDTVESIGGGNTNPSPRGSQTLSDASDASMMIPLTFVAVIAAWAL